jgi:hypothetical protein
VAAESSAFDRVLDALEARDLLVGVRALCPCPSHGARQVTLKATPRGARVFIHCASGCPLDDILGALGLEPGDLIDGEGS